ncbi:hypothetical protein HYU91_04665 [Candidatus Collierbacteria bacterium]|nr:hypothetical protein [Candidatus Collierbacteria bacterium]
MKPEELLQSLNLSADQTSIYLSLLRHGPQSASQLAKSTNVKRTYVYTVSQELAKLGLVKSSLAGDASPKAGKASTFTPNSPDILLDLSEQIQLQAKAAKTNLENILPDLQSAYRLTEIRPIISSFEGLEGIKQTYKDINKLAKNLLLFRSVLDDKNQELNSIINEQIRAQIKLDIHTRTITPLEDDTKNNYLFHDQDRLVERHITQNPKYLLPSQIIVYGSKVAITSLKGKIISTIIDSVPISATFSDLFEILWENTATEHREIVSTWIQKLPKSEPAS